MSESELTVQTVILPPTTVTMSDMSRLVRELEQVDADMTAITIREKEGVHSDVQPVLSEQLADFVRENHVVLEDEQKRGALIAVVRQLKGTVPMVHVTVAAMIDRDSVAELIQWFRASIHPQTVLAIGVQPAIIGGMYMRTKNHVYDMSVRRLLQEKRDSLMKGLEAARGSS